MNVYRWGAGNFHISKAESHARIPQRPPPAVHCAVGWEAGRRVEVVQQLNIRVILSLSVRTLCPFTKNFQRFPTTLLPVFIMFTHKQTQKAVSARRKIHDASTNIIEKNCGFFLVRVSFPETAILVHAASQELVVFQQAAH
jgi:hypothetical protein